MAKMSTQKMLLWGLLILLILGLLIYFILVFVCADKNPKGFEEGIKDKDAWELKCL